MTDLFPPPPVFTLPVVKGQDLRCDFVYKPLVVDDEGLPVLADGQPQYAMADYPEGATVTLTIDTDPPTVLEATITGAHAIPVLDYLEADQLASKLLWRCVLTTTDGIDTVLAHGTTQRRDGK